MWDQFFRASRMAFHVIRFEYALNGRSNYITWKDRMEALPEDNGLKEFIDDDNPKLEAPDAKNIVEWNKCETKARRLILEGV